MKRIGLIFIVTTALLVLFWEVIQSTRATAERLRRAEVNMLDLIRAGVVEQLSKGAEMPTNWLAISNMVNWQAVTNMAQPGIPATERYTSLEHPVPFTNVLTTGSVFLARSKPQSWPGLPFGRWALVGSTDRVSRVWIPENELMPKIRSQITN